MILRPHGRTKERIQMTGHQMAAVMGLLDFISKRDLTLVCPQCAAMGDVSALQTANGPGDPEWKIDCNCRERRILTTDLVPALDADGDLMEQAEHILRPVMLSMRCRQPECFRFPLEVYRDSGDTIVLCRCLKTTVHPPKPQTVH